jgi:hypothetical protein
MPVKPLKHPLQIGLIASKRAPILNSIDRRPDESAKDASNLGDAEVLTNSSFDIEHSSENRATSSQSLDDAQTTMDEESTKQSGEWFEPPEHLN